MPNLTSNDAEPLEQAKRLRISAGRRALSSIALTTLLSLLFGFIAQASVIQAGELTATTIEGNFSCQACR